MSTHIHLVYCPRCGESRFKTGRFKPWTCPDCALVFFQNTAAAAGVMILDAQQRLLMVQRAKDPSKGKWGLPGGFIDAGETTEEALTRECMEEIGLQIHNPQYLCSQPNTYHYGGLDYDTLDFYFTAHALNPDAIRPMDEVASIHWFPLDSIDMQAVAFDSCREAIKKLQIKLEKA